MVVLDSKWLAPCVANCSDAAPVARISRPTAMAGVGIYYQARHFVVTNATPPQGAFPIACGKDEAHAGRTTAAIGVAHGDWMYYAEVTRGGDRSRDTVVLKRLLTNLGCETRIYLDQSLELWLGENPRSASRHGELKFFRDDAQMATRVFQDTAVVPPATWQPHQARRVRYVRQRATALDPRPSNPDASAESAHSPPATTTDD